MLTRGGNWTALFSLIFLGLTAPIASIGAQDSARMKTILVLGDSLSDGFGLRRSEAYPAVLVQKLRAEGLNYEVVNASQSGGTTGSGLRRPPPHPKRAGGNFFFPT